MAGQISVVVVVVVVSALSACLALVALDAWRGGAIVLDRMIGATKVVVFLNPETSRSDVETIGAQLKAQPGVSAVQLRTKEEASLEIGEIGGPGKGPMSTGIPLPDAWILSLHPAAPRTVGAPSLGSATEKLRVEAEKLRGVQAVSFDRSWVAELDRLTSTYRKSTTHVVAGILGVSALFLFGTFFLGSRALRWKGTVDSAEDSVVRAKVFAYIGLFFAATCGIGTFLLHAISAFAASEFVTHIPDAIQTWLTAVGQSETADTLWLTLAIVVCAVTATWYAARRP